MIEAPNYYGLAYSTDRQSCSLCRADLPIGLIGTFRPHARERVLCDSCLYYYCEPLGLALQGIRLLRQAGAFRLGQVNEAGNLGAHLTQYSVLFEQSARSAWLRKYPLAKVDCEHCLLVAYPRLKENETDLMRAMFQVYQNMRFKMQIHRDLFFLRHIDFEGFSAAMREKAADRVENFVRQTDSDELCPRASKFLYFLDEPVIPLRDRRADLPLPSFKVPRREGSSARSKLS